ncbi:sulfatase [Puniceicoccales bacterium CK1056]|uniref:Sulfatase n=1 Tax=Oceanipulchritudo coccoides TaxID=2706888 RepID=A0A6B2LZS9_9BACT|nr:sulfatase [Oceanipulchritudo coccoides]NDV61576.1 sulfatase [Oceanipulchritudo coccoides]
MTSPTRFLSLIFLSGFVFLIPVSAEEKAPLNVLLIMVDDLRPELSCYGVGEVVSPNIDRLASRGMRFNNAYAQYPVCNPSRASLLTGWRPNEVGIVTNNIPLRKVWPDVVTLPQIFRENGYFTAGFGKIFHLGLNADQEVTFFEDPQSFDIFYDARPDASKLGKTGEGRNLTDGRLGWCQWLAANGDDEDQADGLLAKAAIKILNEKRDRPFFIGLGFHKPHDPFIAPKKYFDLYPVEDVKLAIEPDNRSPRVRHAIPNERDFSSFTDKERKEFKRAYQACVSFTDAQIGKVFSAMDKLNLWDTTIVILMGDHGYHLGEHDWWNKVTVYELGARAPMAIWVPGTKGMGRSTDAIVEFVDLYPTLLDLTGLNSPHKLSGVSVRPVFDDPDLPGKQAAFTQVNRGKVYGRSVRTRDWRYTEWGETGELGIELYNKRSDDGEYYNLAESEKHSNVRKHMKQLLYEGFIKNQEAH